MDGYEVTRGNFSLVPHPASMVRPPLQISGRVGRRPSRLFLDIRLVGPLHQILIPAPAAVPARRDRLWEETCFELFIAPENSPGYWEFNLSPSGDWNVYRFSGYRQGMEEETAFTTLPFTTEVTGDVLRLGLGFDTDKLLTDRLLEAGVSAVFKTRSGVPSFWALTHCGPRPDFHRRDCFLIRLPALGKTGRPLHSASG